MDKNVSEEPAASAFWFLLNVYQTALRYIPENPKFRRPQFPCNMKSGESVNLISQFIVRKAFRQIQLLCFLTLSIVVPFFFFFFFFYFFLKTFRKLDSVSVFRCNLLSWPQSVHLLHYSGHCTNKSEYTRINQK
jgi:hypothetical protein